MSYTPSSENNFDFDCEYSPSWYNEFNFPYMGCGNVLSDIGIGIATSMVAELVVGEEWNITHGQTVSAELTQTEIPWEFVCLHGSETTLRVSPAANFASEMWHGDNVASNLKTFGFVYMSAWATHGENVSHHLARHRMLDTALDNGSAVSVDMRYSIAEGMVTNLDNGSLLEADLNFAATAMRASFGIGETATIADLFSANPVPLNSDRIQIGETTTTTLSNAYRFPIAVILAGETTTAELTNTEDGLWRCRMSESTEVELSTDHKLGQIMAAGDLLECSLHTRDPIHIDTRIYDGCAWYVDLRHLFSAALYPYPIVCDSWLDLGIDPAWLHFSTCASCRLPIRHTDFIIQTERFEDVRTTWSAEIGTATAFELSRDIRPEANSAGGEFMSVSMETTLETVPNTMFDGSGVYPFYLTTDENTSTDRTNPILDGNDIITDNGSPEQEPEDFLSMRGGEYGLALLAIERRPVVNLGVGEAIKVDLEIYEPWRIKIYVGETVNVKLQTTIRLEPNCYDGSWVDGKFHEEPIRIGHGETLDFLLKLTYDVEWNETGCLDNEWAYDDKSKNTPATIEQTPFRHSLKARCY